MKIRRIEFDVVESNESKDHEMLTFARIKAELEALRDIEQDAKSK